MTGRRGSVFLDLTGRRRKIMFGAGAGVGVLAMGYIIALVVGLLGGPQAPGLPFGPSKKDPARSPMPNPAAPMVPESPGGSGVPGSTGVPGGASAPSLDSPGGGGAPAATTAPGPASSRTTRPPASRSSSPASPTPTSTAPSTPAPSPTSLEPGS